MTLSTYEVFSSGSALSDVAADLLASSVSGGEVLLIPRTSGGARPGLAATQSRRAMLVELDTETLASAVPDNDGRWLGFARWRAASTEFAELVELVVPDDPSEEAVAAARAVLEGLGWVVVRSRDRDGRIVNRLIRPQYNRALAAVDEGLASGEDIDTIVRLGLGYRRGLLAPLEAEGLARHSQVSSALYEATGEPSLLPGRRARAAAHASAAGGATGDDR